MQWVRIFENEQQAEARLKDDKPQLVIVHAKRICLVLHRGKYFAVQDSCTHNGDSLSKGTINYLGEVICPWHNYRFDLSTGRESGTRSADLVTFPIKIDETGFYVGL